MKKSSTLKRLVTATTSKLILMLMLGVQAIFAQPTIWTGLVDTDWYNASETEFTINTAEQLAGLAKLVNEEDNFSGKTVKLGQNIALNDTANWVNWETVPPANVWVPITFNGTFDGNGFVVSGVYMNDNGYNRGLFGSTNSAAIIKNVGVVASYIKANNTVGGLAGSNYGLISNSYFIGTVAGTSYNVGGLVGLNSGIINNSYSVGKVTGTGSVGGLVGGNPPYSVEINSYYNKEISGQSDEGKGVGKTTAEMQSMEFTDSLNFFASILSANAWIYSAGKYPVLSQTPAHTNINISDFFEGGNGTEAHPYIISTKKQLENFSWLVNSGAHFSDEFLKLGRDIVLNDTVNWKNWATTPPANKWTPIGAFNFSSRIGNMFNGTFDGDGFVVSGVYMNNNGYYQGLFGYLDFGGTIKNIGVAASYIKGNSQIGGLVGSNLGTISNSYFTGVIEAEYGFVGGLAGSNSLTVRDASIKIGSISNSYFIGTVKGTSSVGGLVGSNADHMAGNSIGGSISNSYSLGRVIGSGNDIGGLVGGNYAGAAGSGSNRIGGTISNSYSVSRVEASEGSTNVGGLAGSNGNSYYNTNGTISGYYNTDSTSYNNGLGTGKTTAEMRQRTTFPGWNFNAIWGIDSKVNNGYPYLRWSIPDIAWFDDSKSEFLITEPQQLAGFATLVNAGHNFSGKTVTLGRDIMISDTTGWQSWASNPPVNRWVPIGTPTNSFAGTFDGNGNAVGGIYINDLHGFFQGLFGVTSGTSTIKNVGVIASYIKGINNVGGLAGRSAGTVENSYSAAVVVGENNIGGLVGNGFTGSIIKSYSIGTVTGAFSVGGLVGIIANTISDNYSTAKVSGQSNVGGLVGNNDGGMIFSSYSAGAVAGTSSVGGLVGANSSGTVNTSYYDRQTSNQSDNAGKGMGRTTEQMKQVETYGNDWYFVDIWGINGNINEGYPHLLWSSKQLCEEAGHTYQNNVCKNAEEIEKETCEATEGMVWSDGQCTAPSISLPKIAISQIRVRVMGNAIVLENMPQGAKAEVYNLRGEQVHSATPHSLPPTPLKITVQTKGMYIVKVGAESFRVAVR